MEHWVAKLGKQWVLAFALAAGSLSAHATLLGRDINGNPVAANDPSAVFEYDTYLNITWLRDWNYAQTSGFDADGRMDWNTAIAWASGLTVGTFGGWRLPTSDTGCYGYGCTGSEMGHVWYTELGNTAGNLMNTAPFKNLQSMDSYWSGTEYAPSSGLAWYFITLFGYQYYVEEFNPLYAVAVRPGDVAVAPEPSAAPEPASLLLLGVGTLGLALSRRKGN